VSSSGTPRITRGIVVLTLPPDESSSLAMWCLMSPSSPSPSPAHPPPLLILIPPPCFPLTRWSSHLFRGLLQVLLPRATYRDPVPAPRSPVLQRARDRRPSALPRPLVLPRPLRSTRLRRRRPLVLPRHLHGSLCRYTCTSAVRDRRRHSRSLLHRGLRHHRRSPYLLVLHRRSTTRRCFTGTRGMFTRW
jgi:hypothetical protein